MSGRCGGAQRARARLPIRRCAGRRPRAHRVQPPRAACAAIDSGAHGRCQCRPCRGASPTAHRMAPWERCRAVTYSPARTPLHAAGHAAGHECSPPASAPGCAPRRLRRPVKGASSAGAVWGLCGLCAACRLRARRTRVLLGRRQGQHHALTPGLPGLPGPPALHSCASPIRPRR